MLFLCVSQQSTHKHSLGNVQRRAHAHTPTYTHTHTSVLTQSFLKIETFTSISLQKLLITHHVDDSLYHLDDIINHSRVFSYYGDDHIVTIVTSIKTQVTCLQYLLLDS